MWSMTHREGQEEDGDHSSEKHGSCLRTELRRKEGIKRVVQVCVDSSTHTGDANGQSGTIRGNWTSQPQRMMIRDLFKKSERTLHHTSSLLNVANLFWRKRMSAWEKGRGRGTARGEREERREKKRKEKG